jgi:DNA ligase-1
MYKGNTVSVGSGFSVYDRIRYRNEPKLIQDKIITVQWFEESADKNGKLSLRFPTVKHVFEGKREV